MPWVEGEPLTPTNLNSLTLGPMYNVVAYGASASLTSNTASVQSTLNAAAAATGGGVVYIPSGISYAYSDITWPNGVLVIDASALNEPGSLHSSGASAGGELRLHFYGAYADGVGIGQLTLIGRNNPSLVLTSEATTNFNAGILWRTRSLATQTVALWQIRTDPSGSNDSGIMFKAYNGTDNSDNVLQLEQYGAPGTSSATYNFGWLGTPPPPPQVFDWDLHQVSHFRISSRDTTISNLTLVDPKFTLRVGESNTSRKVLYVNATTNDFRIRNAADASDILQLQDSGQLLLPLGTLLSGNGKYLKWSNSTGNSVAVLSLDTDNNVYFGDVDHPAGTSGDLNFYTSAIKQTSLTSTGQWRFSAGSSTQPVFAFSSEVSLGLYRSATSTLALSYGTFNLGGAILSSVRTTNASGTSATVNDKELRIVAVSVSSAQLAFRSGNTTYLVNADATAL